MNKINLYLKILHSENIGRKAPTSIEGEMKTIMAKTGNVERRVWTLGQQASHGMYYYACNVNIYFRFYTSSVFSLSDNISNMDAW